MEHNLWRRVRYELRPLGVHLVPVENPKWPGTPDINWCYKGVEGWIELKYVLNWPQRAETILRVSHFTTQQRLWLDSRYRARGRVHVLLQVSRDYLLLSPPGCLELGKFTQEQLEHVAKSTWTRRTFTGSSLLKHLLEGVAR